MLLRFFLLFFSMALTLVCLGQNKAQKDSMSQYVHYVRNFKSVIKKKNEAQKKMLLQYELLSDSSKDSFKDTSEDNFQDNGKILDSFKYSFVQRRGCYSFSTGYKNPLGFFGLKFEDRLILINSKFQFGLGIGYSTFLGLRTTIG